MSEWEVLEVLCKYENIPMSTKDVASFAKMNMNINMIAKHLVKLWKYKFIAKVINKGFGIVPRYVFIKNISKSKKVKVDEKGRYMVSNVNFAHNNC